MEKPQKIKSVAEKVFEKIEREQVLWNSMSEVERDQIVRYSVNKTLALQEKKERIENLKKDYKEEKSAFTKSLSITSDPKRSACFRIAFIRSGP